ncbi:MAG: HlyD family efflux transporter periplasmic adaptor subunit [Syntrophomonadaceae bacterium]|nr:HlyD family efflux transporter periplasmic adaptor subunit [Syntrophomonadaceae bacterium]
METRKRLFIVLGVLIIAGLGYWGYSFFLSSMNQDITATGTIETTSVALHVKTPGTIEELSVREGDQVRKEQVVARIVRDDLVAQRESALMTLEKAQAQLADMVSGARAQEIEAAAANVNIARIAWEKSNSDLQTRELLFKQGAISEEELERYRIAAEVDHNKFQSAQAALSLAEAGSRANTVAAARAEVERCRALLKSADALLEDLKVISPLDGVVLTKNYQAGEFTQAGTTIATVADLQDLWIRVYVPTDDLPKIKLGQAVTFTVTGSRENFHGKVVEIASKGEFTPKSIQTKNERANVVFGVKIRVVDQNELLKPGMPADVVFTESE